MATQWISTHRGLADSISRQAPSRTRPRSPEVSQATGAPNAHAPQMWEPREAHQRHAHGLMCQSAFKTDPALGEHSAQASGPQVASSSVGFACGASGFLSGFALGEAVGCVARLDDAAVVGYPIEQRGGHLGIAEDRYPFAELEIGRDDDAGCFIEFADQVE